MEPPKIGLIVFFYGKKLAFPRMTLYICMECNTENDIKPKDNIRCSQCNYRIMYKKRLPSISPLENDIKMNECENTTTTLI